MTWPSHSHLFSLTFCNLSVLPLVERSQSLVMWKGHHGKPTRPNHCRRYLLFSELLTLPLVPLMVERGHSPAQLVPPRVCPRLEHPPPKVHLVPALFLLQVAELRLPWTEQSQHRRVVGVRPQCLPPVILAVNQILLRKERCHQEVTWPSHLL